MKRLVKFAVIIAKTGERIFTVCAKTPAWKLSERDAKYLAFINRFPQTLDFKSVEKMLDVLPIYQS